MYIVQYIFFYIYIIVNKLNIIKKSKKSFSPKKNPVTSIELFTESFFGNQKCEQKRQKKYLFYIRTSANVYVC